MKINTNLTNAKTLDEIVNKAKKRKPQFGNSRSFACNAKRKSWKCNKQKITLNGRTYFLAQQEIKSIKKKLGMIENRKEVSV